MKLTDEEQCRRWRRMWAHLAINREDLARYHRRSNEESMAAALMARTKASVRVKEKP